MRNRLTSASTNYKKSRMDSPSKMIHDNSMLAGSRHILRFAIPAAAAMLLPATSSHAALAFNAVPDPGTPQYVIDAFSLALLAPTYHPDATMHFNSNAPFDFNPADGTTSGQFDFVTIAAHEIGHVLGFESIINTLELSPIPADQLPSSVLDLFRFSA